MKKLNGVYYKNLLIVDNSKSLKAWWYRLLGWEVKTGQELWDDMESQTIAGRSGSKKLIIIK